MNKKEVETVINSYLSRAREISYDFSNGSYAHESYLKQFINDLNKVIKKRTLLECKIDSLNKFIDELIKIRNRINELKDGDVDE